MEVSFETHSVDGENEGFWKRWFDLHIIYILHNAPFKINNLSHDIGENDMKTLV